MIDAVGGAVHTDELHAIDFHDIIIGWLDRVHADQNALNPCRVIMVAGDEIEGIIDRTQNFFGVFIFVSRRIGHDVAGVEHKVERKGQAVDLFDQPLGCHRR